MEDLLSQMFKKVVADNTDNKSEAIEKILSEYVSYTESMTLEIAEIIDLNEIRLVQQINQATLVGVSQGLEKDLERNLKKDKPYDEILKLIKNYSYERNKALSIQRFLQQKEQLDVNNKDH